MTFSDKSPRRRDLLDAFLRGGNLDTEDALVSGFTFLSQLYTTEPDPTRTELGSKNKSRLSLGLGPLCTTEPNPTGTETESKNKSRLSLGLGPLCTG